jgi:hypothetical protein
VTHTGPLLGVLGIAIVVAASAASEPLALDSSQRDHLALAIAPLSRGFDTGEVDAYGRVLDPQPFIDAALARAVANSVAERSQRELTRVRQLHRGAENASARELEAAEDADRRARLDTEAADARFGGAWGPELAARQDIAALLTQLRRGTVALARFDVAAGEETLAAPAGLHIAVAARPERALAAHVVGRAPTVDPVIQGTGWFVLIAGAPPPAGTALVGTLSFADRSFEGFVVPRSAIVRHDGRAYVYVESPPGTFERRAVSLLRARADGWLATGAIAAPDRVVVRGAQQLLATELAVGGAN